MASSSENPDIVADKTLDISGILSSLSSLHGRVSGAALSVSQNPADGDQHEMGVQCEKICRELDNIKSAFTKLEHLGEEVAVGLVLVEKNVDEVLAAIREASGDGSLGRVHPKLRTVSRSILRLRIQLPLIPQVDFRGSGADRNAETGDGFCVHNELASLYLPEKYEHSPALGGTFDGLGDRAWRLILVFAVFPAGSVVNKRVLKNWWDGEGLLELSAEKTAEGLFEELMVRCLVEPVREGCRLVGFKMRPFVHFAVVARALEEGFFTFGSDGNPTVQLSRSGRGCLVKTKEGPSSLDKLTRAPDSELEGLQTLFNVNEPYPDFKLEFFLKLKGLKVLSLGKWQRSSDHHIEVEGTEFLNGLKRMRDLRLFSLRGISRVSEIPDAVCNLGNLRILDLNSCHNLEVLPDGIGSLKKLIYLDISECYLLDSMPKELASLTELQVLKGFLVIDSAFRDSCRFTDLAGLKKLKKLSVNANRKDFPRDDELRTFLRFEQLKKLRISWGGRSILAKPENQSDVDSTAEPRDDGAISNQNETSYALEVESGQEGGISTANQGDVKDMVACNGDSMRTRETIDASEIVSEGCATNEEEGNATKSSRARELDRQHINVTVKDEGITSPIGAARTIKQEGQTTGRSKKAKATNTRMKKILSKLPTFKQQDDAELMKQELFKALQKLDLQCYPSGSPILPDWLRPQNMKSLKKLYVRGGKLRSFTRPRDTDSWSVEIVRLKFLDELEMNWDAMQALFPRLVYLEKFECRKLTSFPCNSSGVWVKRSEDCSSS